MMKTTEDGARCNSADALNCPMERRIFVERAMNSRHIIIGSILPKDSTEVRLAEHDHVVETFPSDRADQSLRVCILPRRARGNGLSRMPMARNRRVTASASGITRPIAFAVLRLITDSNVVGCWTGESGRRLKLTN